MPNSPGSDLPASPRDQEIILIQGLIDRVDGMTATLRQLELRMAELNPTVRDAAALRTQVLTVERRVDRIELTGRILWVVLSAMGAAVLGLVLAVVPTLLHRWAAP